MATAGSKKFKSTNLNAILGAPAERPKAAGPAVRSHALVKPAAKPKGLVSLGKAPISTGLGQRKGAAWNQLEDKAQEQLELKLNEEKERAQELKVQLEQERLRREEEERIRQELEDKRRFEEEEEARQERELEERLLREEQIANGTYCHGDQDDRIHSELHSAGDREVSSSSATTERQFSNSHRSYLSMEYGTIGAAMGKAVPNMPPPPKATSEAMGGSNQGNTGTGAPPSHGATMRARAGSDDAGTRDRMRSWADQSETVEEDYGGTSGGGHSTKAPVGPPRRAPPDPPASAPTSGSPLLKGHDSTPYGDSFYGEGGMTGFEIGAARPPPRRSEPPNRPPPTSPPPAPQPPVQLLAEVPLPRTERDRPAGAGPPPGPPPPMPPPASPNIASAPVKDVGGLGAAAKHLSQAARDAALESKQQRSAPGPGKAFTPSGIGNPKTAGSFASMSDKRENGFTRHSHGSDHSGETGGLQPLAKHPAKSVGKAPAKAPPGPPSSYAATVGGSTNDNAGGKLADRDRPSCWGQPVTYTQFSPDDPPRPPQREQQRRGGGGGLGYPGDRGPRQDRPMTETLENSGWKEKKLWVPEKEETRNNKGGGGGGVTSGDASGGPRSRLRAEGVAATGKGTSGALNGSDAKGGKGGDDVSERPRRHGAKSKAPASQTQSELDDTNSQLVADAPAKPQKTPKPPKPLANPLEALDPDSSSEEESDDEGDAAAYAVLDLNVPRTALVLNIAHVLKRLNGCCSLNQLTKASSSKNFKEKTGVTLEAFLRANPTTFKLEGRIVYLLDRNGEKFKPDPAALAAQEAALAAGKERRKGKGKGKGKESKGGGENSKGSHGREKGRNRHAADGGWAGGTWSEPGWDVAAWDTKHGWDDGWSHDAGWKGDGRKGWSGGWH